ncbi:unnamed protein product [Penicillium bialowiezense]
MQIHPLYQCVNLTMPGATAKLSIVLLGCLVQILIHQFRRFGFSLPRPVQRIDDAWTRFVDNYTLLWWLVSTSIPAAVTFIGVKIMRDDASISPYVEGNPVTVSIRGSDTLTTFTGDKCAIQSSVISLIQWGIEEGMDYVVSIDPPMNSAAPTRVV